MTEQKRYGHLQFGHTLDELKALVPHAQTVDGIQFDGPARKVGAILTLSASAGELIADIERLQGAIEDLELALQDAEDRAESAGRNASAFEDRMGDLQVENGKLRDALRDAKSDLFLQIESKHGPKVASEYPSIAGANSVLDNQGGVCQTCGGDLVGDGYSTVRHCENLDVIGEGYEPDAGPLHCQEPTNG